MWSWEDSSLTLSTRGPSTYSISVIPTFSSEASHFLLRPGIPFSPLPSQPHSCFCSLISLSACNLNCLIDFFTHDLNFLFLAGEGNLSLTRNGFLIPRALPYGKKLAPSCRRRVSHARNVFLFLSHPPLFHFHRQQCAHSHGPGRSHQEKQKVVLSFWHCRVHTSQQAE